MILAGRKNTFERVIWSRTLYSMARKKGSVEFQNVEISQIFWDEENRNNLTVPFIKNASSPFSKVA